MSAKENSECIGEPFSITRVATRGAFKTQGLRNVEFTGPYFHNGGALTLKQAVDFYARGGNFPAANAADLDAFIVEIPALQGQVNNANKDALVAFMLTLTDDRVRWERAPFDHPELVLPNGTGPATTLPAIGAGGRNSTQGPLRPFLWDGTSTFHFKDAFTN